MQCRTLSHTGEKRCRSDRGATPRSHSPATAGHEMARALGNQNGMPVIQAKLTIGAAGDQHEQEADHVADMVMRMPERSGGCGCGACRSGGMQAPSRDESESASIMRKGADGGSCSSDAGATRTEEEEEGEQGAVQRKGDSGGSPQAGRGFEQRLSGSRGKGTPLSADIRSFMEPRFHYDFSNVRVHTDDNASTMAKEIHAEAFTTGSDLYFRSGRYDPSSENGRKLLAHELTHVIQQSEGAVDGAGTVSRHIQRYTLNGFPTAEAAAMNAAIPVAISTVKSCNYLTWLGKRHIANAIDSKRYDYKEDLGHCGWTFPASWYIEIGKKAFDHSKCCDLASTIAHEASHTEFRTESAARALECNCFSCSC